MKAGTIILRLLRTDDRISTLILRISVGAIILAHGVQKLFGWFGGTGPEVFLDSFNKWFGIPTPILVLVILSDSFAAFLLILGLATRIAAVCIGIVMLGAISIVHWKWGFYMNWFGQERGEGYEFHILVFGVMVALILTGGGKWSVDKYLAQRLHNRENKKNATKE